MSAARSALYREVLFAGERASSSVALPSPAHALAVPDALSATDVFAGGITFTTPSLAHRCFYWRGTGEVIVFREESLLQPLIGLNAVECKFDAPIIPPAFALETSTHVHIKLTLGDGTLVTLKLPINLQKPEQSILANFDQTCMWSSQVLDHIPTCFASDHTCSLTASTSGMLASHIRISDDLIDTVLLRSSGVVKKLWTNFLSGGVAADMAVSAATLTFEAEENRHLNFFFTRNLRLRCVYLHYTPPRNTIELLLDEDVSAYFGEALDPAILTSLTTFDIKHNHMLRVCRGEHHNTFYILVYVNLSRASKLITFRFETQEAPSHVSLEHVHTRHDVPDDLLDMVISTEMIWLLSNAEGGIVLHSPTSGSDSLQGWSQVVPQLNAGVEDLVVPDDRDPRDVFVEYIFTPQRFTSRAIRRAWALLSALPQVPEYVSVSDLKLHVTRAIERQLRNTGLSEMDEATYRIEEQRCWQNFLSLCFQYARIDGVSAGLVLDQLRGFAIVVKQSCIGVILKCDDFERACLLGHRTSAADFSWLQLDDSAAADQALLFSALAHISSFLLGSSPAAFMLDSRAVADNCARTFLESSSSADADHTSSNVVVINSLLSRIQDFGNALHSVLTAVNTFSAQAHVTSTTSRALPFSKDSVLQFVISTRFVQQVHTRFHFVRNLAVLLAVHHQLNLSAATGVLTNQIELCHDILRHCYGHYWASVNPEPRSSEPKQDLTIWNPSVGHRFLQAELKSLVSPAEDISSSMNTDITRLMTTCSPVTLASYLWETGRIASLGQFLMAQPSQYLQDYAHVLLLGLYHLSIGHLTKAKMLFLQAAIQFNFNPSVSLTQVHRFLVRVGLIAPDTSTTDGDILASYYQSIITLIKSKLPPALAFLTEFHKPGQYQKYAISYLVIDIAKAAIAQLSTSRNCANFWVHVFEASLNVGLLDDAYQCIVSMEDRDRKLDSLRQFVDVLCDRDEFQRICEYPHLSHLQEVREVLLSKALAQDLLAALSTEAITFYEVLYSFDVFRMNYRGGALAMYALITRLKDVERTTQPLAHDVVLSLLDLERNAYTAAINALRLLPKESTSYLELPLNDGQGTVALASIADLQRDYSLVDARYQLLVDRKSPDDGSSQALLSISLDETLGMLLSQDKILCAAKVAVSHPQHHRGDGLASVFHQLAVRCAAVDPTIPALQDGELADWELLSFLLASLDSAETNFKYHSIVLDELFNRLRGKRLPGPALEIAMSLKLKYPEALLRVCVKHKQFDLAATTTIELLDDLKEFLDQAFPTSARPLPESGNLQLTACLPHSALSLLLTQFRAHLVGLPARSQESEQTYRTLNDKYRTTVETLKPNLCIRESQRRSHPWLLF
eukprot:m.281613 g.281613  ORF g.281613 m.281613 type:complete len:1361 (-) comp54931_c0_seq10:92-4174(-)